MSTHLKGSKGADNVESQATLRAGTNPYVSQQDIEHVDRLSLEFAARWRSSCHVIIDSHHVTKEDFGFRISPFTIAKVQNVQPTEIWILYITAEETIARIAAHPDGRPAPTRFEADFHTFTQASLAAAYGMAGGIPTFLFDSSSQNDQLIETLHRRLDCA